VATSMARPKKRAPGRPRVAVKRESMLNLKGVPDYKAWLDDFAGHCDLSIADTIGQALAYYAEHRGFRPPPKR
jgi:hypothetical protein